MAFNGIQGASLQIGVTGTRLNRNPCASGRARGIHSRAAVQERVCGRRPLRSAQERDLDRFKEPEQIGVTGHQLNFSWPRSVCGVRNRGFCLRDEMICPPMAAVADA